MTRPDDLHHLVAPFSLDAVDDDERDAVAKLLEADDVAAADDRSHREVIAALASLHEAAPSDATRDAVLAAIVDTPQLSDGGAADRREAEADADDEADTDPPPAPDAARADTGGSAAVVPIGASRAGQGSRLLLAVAAAVVLLAGALIVVRNAPGTDRDSELASLLVADDVRVASLDGSVDGSITVVWSPGQDRYVTIADGLADPGPDRTYELWVIGEEGTPRPALLFDGDGSTEAVGLPDEPVAWAVTEEPEGGSPAPTGDILFIAEVVT